LAAAATDFEKYCQLVETTLDLDQVRLGQFLVKPDFDDDLGELRTELDSLVGRVQRTLTALASELGLDADKVLKLEQSGQLGYYFRLTMKEEKSVRNDRSFTIIEANKSGIKFRNKKLDQLVIFFYFN
jgi:DNA mismatch repair protein MSH2